MITLHSVKKTLTTVDSFEELLNKYIISQMDSESPSALQMLEYKLQMLNMYVADVLGAQDPSTRYFEVHIQNDKDGTTVNLTTTLDAKAYEDLKARPINLEVLMNRNIVTDLNNDAMQEMDDLVNVLKDLKDFLKREAEKSKE